VIVTSIAGHGPRIHGNVMTRSCLLEIISMVRTCSLAVITLWLGACGATDESQPCSASKGEICPEAQACMDDVNCPTGFSCLPDAESPTTGNICVVGFPYCGTTLDPCPEGFACVGQDSAGVGVCAPLAVNCWEAVAEVPSSGYVDPYTSCNVDPHCPFGYAASRVDSGVQGVTTRCFGPCVPLNKCSCENDSECPENAVCDRATSRCAALPWKPPAFCSLPLDPETCTESLPGFAAVDGACVAQALGGCNDNKNRFHSLAVCEGRPVPNACPDGRMLRPTCIACSSESGCGKYADSCAKPCESTRDCDGPVPGRCEEGFCRVNCAF
jgi:hypothetical protein